MMVGIQPFRYEIDAQEDGVRLLQSRGYWSPEAYFFRKAIPEDANFETIYSLRSLSRLIGSKTLDMVEEHRKKAIQEALSVLPFSEEQLLSFFPSMHLPHMESYFRGQPLEYSIIPRGEIFRYKKSPTLILVNSPSDLVVVGKTKGDVDNVIGIVRNNFLSLAKGAEAFGISLRMQATGKEYCRGILMRRPRITTISERTPKNDLEARMIHTLESVTDSFLSNVIVSFREPNEDFEYDIVAAFPNNLTIVAEFKDYTSLGAELRSGTETLKSKIILGISDKTSLLGGRSIVIVNAFPEETLSKLNQIAKSREVLILKAEEMTEERIGNTILWMIMEAFSKTYVPWR